MFRDLVALPDEVRNRLREAGVDLASSRGVAVQRGRVIEARAWSSIEVRAASDDGLLPFVGYSTSYEQPYPVYGGPDAGGWFETMAANSWKTTIDQADDIRLLLNHEGIPLARTRSGTLKLTSDDLGVLNEAKLDPASPLVASIASAMQRGDLDQMSCAFQVLEQSWSPDYSERRILQVRGFDSSVVTYPANEATMALVGASASRQVEPAAGRRGLSLARAEWEQLARR